MNKLLKATIATARMSDRQLLEYGFTPEDILLGRHLPEVGGGVSNSTAILADLAAAAAVTPSSTTTASALAAAGAIQDVAGNIKLVLLKAQEIKELLNYILNNSQLPAASLSNPTAGPVTTSSDNTIWSKLVGVYQIMV